MTKQEGRTTSTGATDGGGESADAAVNADGLRFERDTVEPRIYLASLTDYNAGILHGRWVDADHDTEILHEATQEMLAKSPTAARYGEPAEEWAIHDFEGFGNVRLREFQSLDEVSQLAQGIVEHGQAFGVWWEDIRDMAPEDDPDHTFEHRFEGEFSSTIEWAESLLDGMGVSLDYFPGVPEGLWPYVQLDLEGWVRDMEINGEIQVVEGGCGVYVFGLL
jgi:antirestriction protein